MKKLYLYTLFHANLSFSSIPKAKYPAIIDSCYWPLLDLAKEGHKVGFELPSSTLGIIQRIDRSFVRELSALWDASRCEVVGSGFNQNIFPLIPYEVNKANLARGMHDYEDILGKRPTLAFVNEQTYSGGLPSLYKEAGFQAIMMDWDNASEYHRYPPELRYRPVLAEGVDGTVIPVVWNSSLNSYKFQRAIYDRMSVDEYINEVMVHFPFGEDRALVLYGTDLEIFNYRPITQEQTTGEIRKISSILKRLKEATGLQLVNPSEVLHYFATIDKVKIESPECPVPCKNRDDYNVLRWAVSGRDDVWFNTECHKIFNKVKSIHVLSGENASTKNWDDLNLLWSSDLRTKTTNEKHYEGRKKIGEISNALDRQLEYLCGKVQIEKDFVLFNPHDEPWDAEPYQMEFHFREGELLKPPRVQLNGEKIITQCEKVTYYRDGSIRNVVLVCLPSLGPLDFAQGELLPDDTHYNTQEDIRYAGKIVTVETPAVHVDFAQSTGGDIRALTFPDVFGSPLFGYLSPLYYDHVGHSNDYYSMGVHIVDTEKGVVNDTKQTQMKVDGRRGTFPIRIPIACKIQLDIGIVWKRYYIYQHIPRIDVEYTFYLDNIMPLSFRTGILTLNPQSFSKNYLKFSTVNGSSHVEDFFVNGRRIQHQLSVGTFSSGQCCLGATEGWVDISDQNKGIAMITDKSQLYSVPMIEYEEIKKSYLMRLYNSISESDETGKIFWRGHNSLSFTLLGHKNSLQQVRRCADHANKKLICMYTHGENQYHARDRQMVIKNLVE